MLLNLQCLIERKINGWTNITNLPYFIVIKQKSTDSSIYLVNVRWVCIHYNIIKPNSTYIYVYYCGYFHSVYISPSSLCSPTEISSQKRQRVSGMRGHSFCRISVFMACDIPLFAVLNWSGITHRKVFLRKVISRKFCSPWDFIMWSLCDPRTNFSSPHDYIFLSWWTECADLKSLISTIEILIFHLSNIYVSKI